jgi:hypothetical protein
MAAMSSLPLAVALVVVLFYLSDYSDASIAPASEWSWKLKPPPPILPPHCPSSSIIYMPFGYQNECFTDLECSLKVTAAAHVPLPLPHTHASRQFAVVLSGGSAETLSSAKTLRIYINDVDFPIANHTFHDMETEFSISMSPHQLLVGVHAVHSDVFIQDCPRSFFQASMPLLCRCACIVLPRLCFAVVHSLLFIFFRISRR